MLIINAILLISATVCSAASSTSFGRLRRGVVYTNPEIRNNNQEPLRVSPLRDTNANKPHHRQASRDAQKLPHASPNSHVGEYGSVPSKGSLPHDSLKSPLAPYFDKSSDPYGIGTKALDASKLIVSPSLSKLQHVYSPAYNSFQQDKPIELAGFADFADYPSYGDISKLIQAQDFPQAAVQVPLYKTSYPKVANYNAPSDKDEATPAKEDQAIVKVNGKKISVPVIQVQSGPSVLFESQPFLQPSYPSATIEPAALNFASGASKFNLKTPESAAPFLSPLSSFQGHVVPIQTANSPQFPQYKGAAIQVYPLSSNLPSTQAGFSLYNQPQLQFVKEHGGQPTGNTQPVQPASTGDILNDAEIINKKHPEPHTPQPDDDDDDDERYKSFPEKHEHSSEEDGAERGKSGKRFKKPPTESDFKPSTSFPFKEYDEKFGKHRAQTDDDDSDDKPYSSYKNYSSNDDDDDDGEDESSSEDRAKYVKPSRDSYEEEEENANEKHERHEESDDDDDDDDDSDQTEPKRSRYYGKDFEQEFEQSYRKELPKYMPDVDSYSDLKRRQEGTHQRYDDEPKGGRSQSRNRKVSRPGYRDNAAYGTHMSASKTPRVIHEEFFGYEDPKTVAKSFPKRGDKEEGVRAANHYQGFKGPQIGLGKASHGENNPNSWESWKKDKASAEWSGQLAGPGEGAAFYGANLVNGQPRSLTNAEILRDLTGI